MLLHQTRDDRKKKEIFSGVVQARYSSKRLRSEFFNAFQRSNEIRDLCTTSLRTNVASDHDSHFWGDERIKRRIAMEYDGYWWKPTKSTVNGPNDMLTFAVVPLYFERPLRHPGRNKDDCQFHIDRRYLNAVTVRDICYNSRSSTFF